MIGQGKSVVAEKTSENNVAGLVDNSVYNEKTGDAAHLGASLAPGPRAEDLDLVAFPANIQELKAENEDFLGCCIGN